MAACEERVTVGPKAPFFLSLLLLLVAWAPAQAKDAGMYLLVTVAPIKLGVEVVSARDLMPIDGQGSASACVELTFDGQRFRTAVKEEDLNPVWNERFHFNIPDPSNLPELALEAYVYNVNKTIGSSRSFLGKVRIAGTSFVSFPDAVVLHYPLEKRGMSSRVKGQLGLKVYVTSDPTIKASNPLPAEDPVSNNPPPPPSPAEQSAADITGTNLHTSQEHRPEARTLHTIAKEAHHHHSHGHLPASFGEQPSKYSVDQMKPEPQPPRIVRMYSAASQQPMDYAPAQAKDAVQEIGPAIHSSHSGQW